MRRLIFRLLWARRIHSRTRIFLLLSLLVSVGCQLEIEEAEFTLSPTCDVNHPIEVELDTTSTPATGTTAQLGRLHGLVERCGAAPWRHSARRLMDVRLAAVDYGELAEGR